MKKIIVIFASLIVIIFICCLIVNNYFINKDIFHEKINSDSLYQDISSLNFKSISKSDNNAKELFIKILTEDRDSRKPWIERKEISAWAATILFLSIIMILYNNIKKLRSRKFSIPIIITFLFLFGLFIHQQYGGLIDGMAIQNAFNTWIYKVMQENQLPGNFDFSISKGWDVPNSVKDIIIDRHKYIRKHNICCRIFLPYKFFVSKIFNLKDTFGTVEVEESILYNIIIISTLALLCVMKNKNSKK